MSEIVLPSETDPVLLGNIVIDSLRYLQLQAYELPTLEQRRTFALREAGKLALVDIGNEEWDMSTSELLSGMPGLRSEDWIVAEPEKDIELLAWVGSVAYISGAAAKRDGLALRLRNIRTLEDKRPEKADAPQPEPEDIRFILQGGATYTPVLSIHSLQPTQQAA